jgi:hypothetical protein
MATAPAPAPAAFNILGQLVTPVIIDRARSEFEAAAQRGSEGALTRAEFVTALLPCVLESGLAVEGPMGAFPASPAAVTEQLLHLFNAIDTDGSDGVTWDEFSSFIIAAGIAASHHSLKALEFAYVEQPGRTGRVLATRSKRSAGVSVSQFLPHLQLLAVRSGGRGG